MKTFSFVGFWSFFVLIDSSSSSSSSSNSNDNNKSVPFSLLSSVANKNQRYNNKEQEQISSELQKRRNVKQQQQQQQQQRSLQQFDNGTTSGEGEFDQQPDTADGMMPDMSMPDLNLPGMSNISMPDINFPNMSIPDLNFPGIPGVGLPTFGEYDTCYICGSADMAVGLPDNNLDIVIDITFGFIGDEAACWALEQAGLNGFIPDGTTCDAATAAAEEGCGCMNKPAPSDDDASNSTVCYLCGSEDMIVVPPRRRQPVDNSTRARLDETNDGITNDDDNSFSACSAVENAGLNGSIPSLVCGLAQQAAKFTCNCKPKRSTNNNSTNDIPPGDYNEEVGSITSNETNTDEPPSTPSDETTPVPTATTTTIIGTPPPTTKSPMIVIGTTEYPTAAPDSRPSSSSASPEGINNNDVVSSTLTTTSTASFTGLLVMFVIAFIL